MIHNTATGPSLENILVHQIDDVCGVCVRQMVLLLYVVCVMVACVVYVLSNGVGV